MAAQEPGIKICHVCKFGVPWAWRDPGGWLCPACQIKRGEDEADALARAHTPREHEWAAARKLRTAVACIEDGDIARVDHLLWRADALMKRAERARKLQTENNEATR